MSIENQALFAAVRQLILEARQRVYRMANSALLETYWHIGKLILEDEQHGNQRAAYGKGVLKNLGKQLTIEFGKGFDYSNLTNMRKFYVAFPKLDAVRQELSWTHYRLISRLDTPAKQQYYLSESAANQWNSRELQRQINSMAFERTIKTLPPSQTSDIQNFIKDPYIFEFLGVPQNERLSEKTIEQALIDHLQKFLLELGKGFAFVARQQRISTDASDFFVDLVFYNYFLKCFVLIDLKTGNLSHQDVGQIDMYVRMYDDLKKSETDNPTIGILLCSEKDETIVKYSVLNDKNNLFASKYLLYLPKEEELKEFIERDLQRLELDESPE